MSFILHAVFFAVAAGFVAALVRVLRALFPVGYWRSVFWGLWNGSYILAPVSALLFLASALCIAGGLHMHFMLLFGATQGVIVQGQTSTNYLAFDPAAREPALKEHDLVLTSFSDPALYPGQTFPDAIQSFVLIRAPHQEEPTVLFTSLPAYLMIHFVILLLLGGGLAAAGILMARRAVAAGVLGKLPRKDEVGALFKARTGLSLGKAVLLLCALFVASALFDALVSRKYHPEFDAIAAEEKKLEERLLARVAPGTVLEGRVVERETFSVTREIRRSVNRERSTNRETVTNRYVTYFVRFDGLLDHPVHVSMVYHEDDERPAFLEMRNRLDRMLDGGEQGAFTVNEDYSLKRAVEASQKENP